VIRIITADLFMRSVLEREFFGLCASVASRLGNHDSAAVLGVCLCFAPFPPVTLAGLLLTCLNFVLVWNNRLPKSEIPLLRVGVLAVMVYAVVWTAAISWLIHIGGFSAATGWLNAWRSWLWNGLQAPAPSSSSPIQRI
jgi:hypothetical protein